jgi:hypothetical protein
LFSTILNQVRKSSALIGSQLRIPATPCGRPGVALATDGVGACCDLLREGTTGLSAEGDVDDQRRHIVEGISAIAVALAEMGCDGQTARADLIAHLHVVDDAAVEVLDQAAAYFASAPQDPVGAPGAVRRINAQLQAREWLQQLAADLRAGR